MKGTRWRVIYDLVAIWIKNDRKSQLDSLFLGVVVLDQYVGLVVT